MKVEIEVDEQLLDQVKRLWINKPLSSVIHDLMQSLVNEHVEQGKDEFGVWKSVIVKGVQQVFRWIEPGEFMMGSPVSEAERNSDETQHRVILTHGYWLADTPCTQEFWQAVMGDNQSRFNGEHRPVENVSWNDVQDFIERLNGTVHGLEARLPTEAEWEYACRAGTTTAFWFGDQITTEQVNYDSDYLYSGWRKWKYRNETVEVKALPCNGWGLYQMHGNVWEWCQDLYGDYPLETVIDPLGSEAGAYRVLRGGSWYKLARGVRSAFRSHDLLDYRSGSIGFRLVIAP